jgi:hypothetical protein
VRPKLREGEMNKEPTYYVRMNAYRAVVFVENIQTDELCHYVGDGNQPSGNVKLLGKKHVNNLEDKDRRTRRVAQGEKMTTHESGPPPLTPTTS